MDNTSINPQPPYQPLSGAPVNPETRELEFTQVQTPTQVRAIWEALWQADGPQRFERANVQAMIDGRPPNNPERLRIAGLLGCCNINWRDGALKLEKATAPYVDFLNSVPYFLTIVTKYGDHESRLDWEQIMSEEYGFMLRSWESYSDRMLRLVNYFLAHGVSMAFWNNSTDWRWDIGTLGDFCMPRLSTSDVSSINYMAKRQSYPCAQLFGYIKNASPDERKSWYNGWHCPTVIKAIKNAMPKPFQRMNDWELNEQIWKSSDFYWYLADVVCESILLWVRELDNTISQMIVPFNPLVMQSGYTVNSDEEFMYKEMNFLPRMDRGLVVFKYGVGTNGYIHSVRGLGNAIYPMVTTLNNLRCREVDAINVELSVPVQANEDILNDGLAVQFAGPFMPIMEGVTIPAMPIRDFSKSVYPMMQNLQGMLNDQSGGFAAGSDFGSNEKTKFEIQAMLEMNAGLSVSQASLFYEPLQRLLRESLRRVVDISSALESGGPEAFEWRRRCMDKGVPPQAIDQIDIERCMVVRSIGNGSPAARMAGLAAIEPLVPQFDEQGRRSYVRDRIAAQPGFHYSTADAYMPKAPNLRPGTNVRFAEEENIFMRKLGQTMPVYPNDEHLVHAQQHIALMTEIREAVDAGEMQLEEAVQPLALLYDHTFQHLQLAGNDPMMQREINFYRKDMQQSQEIIVNGSRKIEAEQRRAQEQGEQGPSQQPLDPKELLEIEKQKTILYNEQRDSQFAAQMQQMKLQEQAQKLQSQEAQSRQKLGINDALGALKTVDQTQKIQQNARKNRRTA